MVYADMYLYHGMSTKAFPVARLDAVVSEKGPQCAGNMTKKKPAATFKV